MVRDGYPAPPARSVAAGTFLALILVAVLAGCSVPTRSAPPLGPLTTGAAMEAEESDRRDYLLRGAEGRTLAVSEWAPSGEARVTLIAVHGFGDHATSSFGSSAPRWAARGIRTIAYDQRGFGRNPDRADWPGADALIEDLAAVTAHVRKAYPGEPLGVLGHSMGGAVVAAALGEGRIRPDRAVLLAPALWGGRYLNPAYRFAAGSAAMLFPDRRWSGKGVVRIQASDNIEVLRGLGRDPLYLGRPSSREFLGLIRVMDRAVATAGGVETPVLVLYGTKDEVVPETPIRETAAQFPGLVAYEKIETGWHLLLRDLEGEKVQDRIAGFLLEGT